MFPPGFTALIDSARTRVREIEAATVAARVHAGAALIDVREESEFARGHITGATWLGKGIIERDIEFLHPDLGTDLVLYCGGGYRSLLAADNLQLMGYTSVVSVVGGIGELVEHLELVKP